MTAIRPLPAQFAELDGVLERWAGSNSNDRILLRLESQADERSLFYTTVKPHLGRALEYLDQKAQLTEADARLRDLILTLAHVALSVEQQKDVEPRHARSHAHFSFQRSAADVGGPGMTPSGTC